MRVAKRKRLVRRSVLVFLLKKIWRKRKGQRRFWVRDIFRTRNTKGEYHALILEMRLWDHENFYRYFHMTPQRFTHLLSLMAQQSRKKIPIFILQFLQMRG